MDELTQRAFEDFLNLVAERAPTPGGGSVAAAAGALACALGRMVVAYSGPKSADPAPSHPGVAAATRLARADEIFRALVTQDAVAYTAMTTAKKNTGDRAAFQTAVLGALAVPLETAALAGDVLTTLDDFKTATNRYLLSDLGVAAVLAHSAAESARYLVHVNLPELDDPARRSHLAGEIDCIVTACGRRQSSVAAYVCEALQAPPLGRR